MKNKEDRSGLKRLIVAAAIILVLVITVSIFGNKAFRREIVKINTNHIAELADHDVKIIVSSVSLRLDALEKIALDIKYWSTEGSTSITDLLKADSNFIKSADKIAIVSKDATVISSDGETRVSQKLTDACIAHKESFITRINDVSTSESNAYILFCVPLSPTEYDGHTFEYLCAFIEPSKLENELKLETHTDQNYSAVIDKSGNYILTIDRNKNFVSQENIFQNIDSVMNYASVDSFRDTLSSDESIAAKVNAKTKDEANEYYLVFTPLPGVEWFFVSAFPANFLDAQTRTLMRIAGVLLGVVGLALVAIFLFSIQSRKQQTELREKETTDAMNNKLQEQQTALEEALGLAQSANRAKTTFLNNMSHDIRTPMNAIIGYTGLASSHIDNKEQVQDYLSKIGQSSEHLLSLINDVLDMSRIESGKVNINERNEDLSEILHTTRNIVQADIHNKQIDFFIDTDVNDQFVVCDKLRLNQILLNILSNSIKYTQPGGTVSVRLREIGVTDTGYGKYEFRIKDNGMGMSEEFLKTIFEPFTRVKSSTVSGIQGTGLGMAITKNIIDMMGGTIEIRSKEGEGTEVILTFEFKLGEGNIEPPRIVELEGLKSLVVDDDISACRSVSKMLREAGMRSEWCTSGKEAVVRTEDAVSIGDLFKVYIIDWIMPDMNGIETTRRIRQIVGEQAPIIVLTAYDWSDIEEEAREAGVTAFVSKPLFPSNLHSVLSKCCGTVDEYAGVNEKEYEFEGKKILLVEDNEMNREIAQEILTESGFIVDTAADGTIAVDIMKDAKPGQYDLILMDIQMPIMNGYDATMAIRALPDKEVANVTIIAMTANAFEEDRQQALKSGMNEHIAKPIEIGKLKDTLAKFLN